MIIVTLGNVGLQRLLGKGAKVSKLHGQLLTHSASVFYRPSNRDFLMEDWIKIGDYINSKKI